MLPTLLAASNTPPHGTGVYPSGSQESLPARPIKSQQSTPSSSAKSLALAPVVQLHSDPIIVINQDHGAVAHATALLTDLPDVLEQIATLFAAAQVPQLDFRTRQQLTQRISELQSQVRGLQFHQTRLDDSGTKEGDAYRETMRLATMIVNQLSVTQLRSETRSRVVSLSIMAAQALDTELLEAVEPNFIARLRALFTSY